VLVAQAIGSACITLATFAVAMVVMLVVNATGTLRLPAEAELYGMDLHEHGISAYPEYVITALGAPKGLPAHQQPTGSPVKAPAPAHGD
jgi:Amt family ammonium transporter